MSPSNVNPYGQRLRTNSPDEQRDNKAIARYIGKLSLRLHQLKLMGE